MSAHSELLKHDAELLLRFFNDPEGLRARLLHIERELAEEGDSSEPLHRAIEQLCGTAETQTFRCRYHTDFLID